MSRLFVSYASVDRGEAVVLRDWLEKKGWRDDVFLDVDPQHGIAGGRKWREALRNAAGRCEAVILLLSRAWLESRVCWSEFQLAEKQRKPILPIVIDPELPPPEQLPPELTAYQLIDQVHSSQIEFELRLQRALEDAGAGPENFSVPEGAVPYGGLRPLGEREAALFFGRDAEVLAALDTLRDLRETGRKRILVILGASGAGKSSLLRAGVWARIDRNDRQFLALPVLRPGDAALTGATGLWQVLADACSDPRRRPHLPPDTPRTRAAIATAAERDPQALVELVHALKLAARGPFSGSTDALPSPVLCIDQGEELLSAEQGAESDAFLSFLRVLHDGDEQLLTVLAVRSDVYPQLQQDLRFDIESLRPFNLSPMSEANLASAITGPARRVGLKVEPALEQALLRDARGKDALPLLAFTLERLYHERLDADRLTLQDFTRLGGLAGAIALAAAELRKKALARGVPEAALDGLLRRVFLPHLVRVNEAGAFARRIAQRADFDPSCLPLLELLVEQRLLVSDVRDGRTVFEIAHEAILREWPLLAGWLEAERGFLEWREQLAAARRLNESGQSDLLAGRALAVAQSFLEARRGDLAPADLAFVERSVAAEDERRAAAEAEKERRRQVELDAAREREEAALASAEAEKKVAAQAVRTARRTRVLAGAMSLLAVVAVVAGWIAVDSQQRAARRETEALEAQKESESRRLAAIARDVRARSGDDKALAIAWLALWNGGELTDAVVTDEAASQIYARSIQPVLEIDDHLDLVVSDDGRWAFSQLAGRESRLWRTDTLETVQTFPPGPGPAADEEDKWEKAVPIDPARFTADSTAVGVLNVDALRYQVYDLEQHRVRLDAALPDPREFGADGYLDVAIAPDLERLLLVTEDGMARLFDPSRKRVVKSLSHPAIDPMSGIDGYLGTTFSPSGRRVVVSWEAWEDSHNYVWDLASGRLVNEVVSNEYNVKITFDPSEQFIYLGPWDNGVANLASGQIRELPLGIAEPSAPTSLRHPVDQFEFLRPGQDRPAPGLREYARVFEATNEIELYDEEQGEYVVREVGTTFPGMWILDPYAIARRFDIDEVSWSPAGGGRAVSLSRDEGDCTLMLLDLAADRFEGSLPLTPASGCAWKATPVVPSEGSVVFTLLPAEDEELGTTSTLRMHRLSPQTPAFTHATSTLAASFASTGVLVRAADAGRVETRHRSGEPLWSVPLETSGQPAALATSPDGRAFAVGDWAGKVHVGTADDSGVHELPSHEAAVSAIAFSTDGARLATGGHDGLVHLSEVASRRPIGTLAGHASGISMLAFEPEGERLVSASFDGTVRIWSGDAGEEASLPHPGAVFAARFSPDGTRLATAAEDGRVRLWKLADPGTPVVAAGHDDLVRDVVWSPDGALLLSVSEDRTARLWRSDGTPVATLDGHVAELTHGFFRDDGVLAATADRAGQIRLWDVETGALLAIRGTGGGPLAALAFLDEGRQLLAASKAGPIYSWPVAPGGLRDRIAEVGEIVKALRPLSDEECAQYYLTELPGAADVCGRAPEAEEELE